jgi:SAM-dependent methyltransferase
MQVSRENEREPSPSNRRQSSSDALEPHRAPTLTGTVAAGSTFAPIINKDATRSARRESNGQVRAPRPMPNLLRRQFRDIEHRLYLRKQPRHHKKLRAGLALYKLLNEYEFATVLDIGSSAGDHAAIMAAAGKQVTAIDYGNSFYFKNSQSNIKATIGDFMNLDFPDKFDCVWCSHVLEHQLNVQQFLVRVRNVLAENGALAITVPPLKHKIAGGHVSLWNGGLLLYRLVLAGFDCKDAKILRYGNNISAFAKT